MPSARPGFRTPTSACAEGGEGELDRGSRARSSGGLSRVSSLIKRIRLPGEGSGAVPFAGAATVHREERACLVVGSKTERERQSEPAHGRDSSKGGGRRVFPLFVALGGAGGNGPSSSSLPAYQGSGGAAERRPLGAGGEGLMYVISS